MRLIDADALETHEQLEPMGNGMYEYVQVVYKDDIDDAPTIEPEHNSDDERKIADLHKMVNYLLSQLEQRWIPWDSGKFPEESGTYTVTAYDGATERVTYAKYQKRLKRWELTGARAYWRVLAWMPLPEPWKEGEQE